MLIPCLCHSLEHTIRVDVLVDCGPPMVSIDFTIERDSIWQRVVLAWKILRGSRVSMQDVVVDLGELTEALHATQRSNVPE